MVRGPNGDEMQVASTGFNRYPCAIALFAQKVKTAIANRYITLPLVESVARRCPERARADADEDYRKRHPSRQTPNFAKHRQDEGIAAGSDRPFRCSNRLLLNSSPGMSGASFC